MRARLNRIVGSSGDSTHTAAWCLRSHGVMDTHQPGQFALLTCGTVPS